MALPRFVVLKSVHNDKYLRYTNPEDGRVHGFLRFSGNEVSSPYAKFEVEMAKTNSNGKQFVHIRCCFNNKYFVRMTPSHWWIVAGADEQEEDQSKWSCTLFEILYVDGAIHPTIENVGQTIRFRHVQLGHYASLWRVARPYDLCLYAGSPDFIQDWVDIYTFTDWESLSPSTHAEAFTREKMTLPRFMVLKSNYNNKYLCYIHESGPVHGFLQFSQVEVSSRYAKYELEMAKTSNEKRLVHIKCCYNNKYFVRGSAKDKWIVAGADEPEEDQSKWSCTLFEPLYIDDGAAQTIQFRHIQLGHYVCLWRAAASLHDSCLFAGSPMPDKDQCDVYTIIDWESPSIVPLKDEAYTRETMALPRFVVFKSNFNDKYLRYIHEDGDMQGYLQFSGEEVSSTYAKFEVEIANTSINGKALVHIKCCYNNKYFVRRSSNHWWIKATADEPEEDQSKWSCTLFEPLRVIDSGAAQTTIGSVAQTIRLRHVDLGHYAYLYRQRGQLDTCMYAASKEADKEQLDIFTIIDWETLSLLQPKNEAFTREIIPLPRFAVLKSNYNDKYLRYIYEEDKEMHGFVQFSGEDIVSPYTKYELEMAKSSHNGKRLVHIKCCYNNKYLMRWSPKHNWIVAGADEPKEDDENWTCTLFEPLYIDGVAQTIRFRHILSGYYACLWRAAPPRDSCLFTGSSTLDQDLRDVYTIIDWESLFILPKHVAFKGNNGNYLSACLLEGRQYLHFSSSIDIGDPMVGNEVFTTSNGSVRIKSHHSGEFWKCSNHNWILADSDNSYTPSSSKFLTRFLHFRLEQRRKQKQRQKQKQENNSPESDMLFWPIKVDNSVVALCNVGNKKYCKGLTADGKTNYLSATASTITKEVHLEVAEVAISREICNVDFRLKDARIYNQSIVMLATKDAINRTQEPKTVDVKLLYDESRTRTWNSSISLKLGVKTIIQTAIPFITAEGNIKIFGEFSGDYQWGQTESLTNVVEKVYQVTVPPMTMVRVNLLATRASCDVPFSYNQLDTLTNGEQITGTIDDGIYTGNNCFNFKYETEQEML